MIKAFSILVILSLAVTVQPIPVNAQSETASYGLLWLNIDPTGSQVWLDGQCLDKSVWLLSIAPGLHTLQVGKPEFKSYNHEFEILGGQNLHLDVFLQPLHRAATTDSLPSEDLP